MKAFMKTFIKSEKGMGTIEIVIIIAVLIGLAFLFKTFATDFFTSITEGIKSNNQIDTLFKQP
ncbi:Flp1 family type IVb pilin [Fusibacter tunisiensis]|jgi:Flp pilus assembly pilin Flp|uniref:Flp pilus assembly pilin Flp n=1 Tax=Fusibacter tunisiensis TaxID=1008308 RepID=A0ABS2MMN3_9FIRM|nr:Flp1 family type IVb pilin [Fusibacter tunisiensis]MBM7560663.1 Flp pilus assembly pilin Flp [Fusibacter tunisiensis]